MYVHSIKYTRLLNRFLAFDLYDRWRRVFASRGVLEVRLEGSGIATVPTVMRVEGRAEEDAGPIMPSDEGLKGMASSRRGSMTGGWRVYTSRLRRTGSWSGVERSQERTLSPETSIGRGDLELKGFDNDQG